MVESGGASFHGFSSGMRFIIPVILRRLSSPMSKTGSDKLTGPIQIYHNPKSVLSRGYLYTQEPDENCGRE